jgi:hypothetical protein
MLKNIAKISGFVMLGVLLAVQNSHAGVSTTKHNLSISGPGTVKATSDERICVFCHTPHHAIVDVDGITVPLWNHTLSTASYQLFDSFTLLSPTSPAIQPDGGARLCLSCHDGTVAIGSVVNTGTTLSSIAMQGVGGSGEMPAGPTNMGTDLSGHHPISIEVNSALINDKATQCNDNLVSFKICNPLAGSPVKLAQTNNAYVSGPPSGVGVQCSTCHDPHEDPVPGTSVFLRLGDKNNYDALCSTCHIEDCASACP